MAGQAVLTAAVLEWLAHSQSPRVLHVFDRACNLINERDEILSLVWPELGAGPFALLLPKKRPFTSITSDSSVDIIEMDLWVGDINIPLANAQIWNPRLDWGAICQQQVYWPEILPQIKLILRQQEIDKTMSVGASRRLAPTMHHKFDWAQNQFLLGIEEQDQTLVESAVQELAGLGQGLTPTGDDFLVGAILALWLNDVDIMIVDLIVRTAVSRTTLLSGAWLRAAGQGEFIELWHQFFAGLEDGSWATAVTNILQIGHSSGHDALLGFTAVLEKLIIPH